MQLASLFVLVIASIQLYAMQDTRLAKDKNGSSD